MAYRPDIDGLRALSVVVVILFHTDVPLFSGGYVGVDVFFVISGFLITQLILKESESAEFSHSSFLWTFYKRRAARLLPALIITLTVVALVAVCLYDNKTMDRIGRELFFSAIGAANILYAQGADYFVQDLASRPLAHLWSLGVEEQFYVIWPTCLILLTSRLGVKNGFGVTLALMIALLVLSEIGTLDASVDAYHLPQYRFYELLVGAALGMFMHRRPGSTKQKSDIGGGDVPGTPKGSGSGAAVFSEPAPIMHFLVAATGLMMIAVPIVAYDASTRFPGIASLWPVLGTALLIGAGSENLVARFFRWQPLVYIGLISYPLYLYHLPVISYLSQAGYEGSPWIKGLIVLAITTPLAWITYRFIEKPIRAVARQKRAHRDKLVFTGLVTGIASLGIVGVLAAKTSGFPARFKALNPFAFEIRTHNLTSFGDYWHRGRSVARDAKARVLFVGDSVMQQYIYPFTQVYGIETTEVDSITRGGCVLLKGVDFLDKFADISCDDLREELYAIDTRYDLVVISQSWESYDNSITNSGLAPELNGYTLKKWHRFIKQTIEHFEPLAKDIVLIGGHPRVEGTRPLLPSMVINEDDYRQQLSALNIKNEDHLSSAVPFFEAIAIQERVHLIQPVDLWCASDCDLHNGSWSYFKDEQHITRDGEQHSILEMARRPLALKIDPL